MGFNSIPMFFVCVAILFLCAATPIFSACDAPPRKTATRLFPIDGLRGILALSVFFHHGTFVRFRSLTGHWANESHFYDMIGPAGVSMFFMITGYLFWAKILRANGRPSWFQLYVGRIFRIAPLYLLVVLVVFIAVAIKSDFLLIEPLSVVALQMGSWLGLGIFDSVDINAVDDTWQIVAGVLWSLRYEWAFYASLFFLAVIRRNISASVVVVAASLLVCLVGSKFFDNPGFPPQLLIALALFLVGMLCAETKDLLNLSVFPPWLVSLAAVLSIALMFRSYSPYSAGTVLFLGVSFFLIVNGCTVFGVLTSRPAKRLGDVSYGIYLLHGIVLFLVSSTPWLRSTLVESPIGFWFVMLGAGLTVIGAATVAHVLVERPGIAMGERVALLVTPILTRRNA